MDAYIQQSAQGDKKLHRPFITETSHKERITDVVTDLKSQWKELRKSYWEIKELDKDQRQWYVIRPDLKTLIDNCEEFRERPEVSENVPLSLEFELLQKSLQKGLDRIAEFDRLPENPFARIEQILTTDRNQLLAMTLANCQESWTRLQDKHQEIHEYFQKHFTDEQNEPDEDIRYQFEQLICSFWKQNGYHDIVPEFNEELERLSAALSTQLQEIASAAKSCGKETDLCLLHKTAQIKSCLEIVQKDMEFYQLYIPLDSLGGYPHGPQDADSAEEIREGWLCFLPVQKKIFQQVEQLFGNSHCEEVGQTPREQDDPSQTVFWSQTSFYQLAHQCDITNFLKFRSDDPHTLKPFLVSSHNETKEAVQALQNLLKAPRIDLSAFQGDFPSLEKLQSSLPYSLDKPHERPDRPEEEQWSGLIDVVTGWWDQANRAAIKCPSKSAERFLSPWISLQVSEIRNCLIEQGNNVQQKLVKLPQEFYHENDAIKRKDIKAQAMDFLNQLYYATAALDQENKCIKDIVARDQQYQQKLKDLLDAETSAKTEKAKMLVKKTEGLVLWFNEIIRNHPDCSNFREQIESAGEDLKYFHQARAMAIQDHTPQKPASQILTDFYSTREFDDLQKEIVAFNKPIAYSKASKKAEVFATLLSFLKGSRQDNQFWSKEVDEIANYSSFAQLKMDYTEKEHNMYAAWALGPALDQFLEIGQQLYKLVKAMVKTARYKLDSDTEKALERLRPSNLF